MDNNFLIIVDGKFNPAWGIHKIAKSLNSLGNGFGFGDLNYDTSDSYATKLTNSNEQRRVYYLIELIFNRYKTLYNKLTIKLPEQFPLNTVDECYSVFRIMSSYIMEDYKKSVIGNKDYYTNRNSFSSYCKKIIEDHGYSTGGFNIYEKPIQEFLFKAFDKINSSKELSINKVSSKYKAQFKELDFEEKYRLALNEYGLFDENGVFKGYFNNVKDEIQTIIIVLKEKGYFKDNDNVRPGNNYLFANALSVNIDKNDKTLRKSNWVPSNEMKSYYLKIIPGI